MRCLFAALVLGSLHGAPSLAQTPTQLPTRTRVRIELANAPDSLLEGTIRYDTEGCTLVLIDLGYPSDSAKLAPVRSIARLWIRSGKPDAPWQLYPMDRLRAAEPSGCLKPAATHPDR